jgi:hypothetical protein
LHSNVIENKILTQKVYGKLFLRSTLFKDKNLHLLENNSNFTVFSNVELKRLSLCSLEGQFPVGQSCFLNNTLFKNQKRTSLKFQSFSANFLPVNPKFTDDLYASIDSLTRPNTNGGKSLLILNPVKGGFVCYSSGILGFLPKSHGLKALGSIYFSFLKDNNLSTLIPNLNFLFNSSHFIKKYFLIRLPLSYIKLNSYPQSRKNNFSAASKKKKRIFNPNLNFVFLRSKYKQKN